VKRSASTQSMKDLQGVYQGSVVWQYFVKNKQQFDKIVSKGANN